MDESAAHEDDFDRVMAPAHQARWLVEPKWRDRDGQRPGDLDWRQRDTPRFERLRAMKVWPEVEDVLRWYLHAGVPAARRSEWPLDDLIELLLRLDPPASNTPTEPDA